jgi:hypothetical protein
MARIGALAALLLTALSTIATDRDAAAAPCRELAERLRLLSVEAPELDRSKTLWIYLPPDYPCAGARRFPVFYLNDGHDLFDWYPHAAHLGPALATEIARREGWYGSWRLARQLDRAIESEHLPALLVVGIGADDGRRSIDLSPVPWDGAGQTRGDAYLRFVTGVVVAEIDRRFRTVAQARCRGMGGASLGGFSALQIGLERPDLFGMVLSLSPLLADPALRAYLGDIWSHARPGTGQALLLDFDDDPPGLKDLNWLAGLALDPPLPILRRTPGARHRIDSWAQRIVPALKILLPGDCRG